jgi:hypothetical protein
MPNKPKIIIGLALNKNINNAALHAILIIIKYVKYFFKCDVLILLPIDISLPSLECEVIKYPDDDSLFDFSRYHRMLSLNALSDKDILIAFNDTLGCGRKLNTGLRVYIFIALYLLLSGRFPRYRFFAPVDSDEYNMWVCPYFFVGKVAFLRTLNFSNWIAAREHIEKSTRYRLIKWLKVGWRGAQNTTCKQKRTKFKTLMLERNLINSTELSKFSFMFSRSNFLRILNSFPV